MHRRSLPHTALMWALVTAMMVLIPNCVLSVTEQMPWTGRVANILLPGGVYALLLTLSRRTGRAILWFLPLMVFAAFQIVLLWMYERSVLAVDMLLNVMTTNSGEVTELLSDLWPAVLLVILLYVPPLSMGVWLLLRKASVSARGKRRSGIVAGAVAAAGAAFLTAACFAPGYSPLRSLFPLNLGYNMYLAWHSVDTVRHYPETSAPFTFGARATHPEEAREVYVLVIGETSRSNRFGINGCDRPTTPRLARLMAADSGLVTMPRVLSQSNTTHKSVPLLLSHLDATNFGDSIARVKSLITAFKEAGFRTAFVSNQCHNRSYIDFFGNEADTVVYLREPPRLQGKGMETATDLDLLPELDALLTAADAPRKLLVVLHAYGSHFSYVDRYRGRMEPVFVPDEYSKASRSNRPALINAYDNTIALTDSLLAGIVTRLERLDEVDGSALAGMLYTSDHGEDIFDDGTRLFLHASPCPTFHQIHVPFIIWTSRAWRALNPGKAEAAHAHAGLRGCSSTAFFQTALLLGGVEAPGKSRPELSPLSPGYKEPEPVYLNDHNRAVTLKETGFRKLDFRNMESL